MRPVSASGSGCATSTEGEILNKGVIRERQRAGIEEGAPLTGSARCPDDRTLLQRHVADRDREAVEHMKNPTGQRGVDDRAAGQIAVEGRAGDRSAGNGQIVLDAELTQGQVDRSGRDADRVAAS
jgi:hypothetical protein